jgi:serine protease AprX
MTTFSSVGPTSPDGLFKPDLVASGRSVVSLRAPGSTIDTDYPSARVGSSNFVGTGTSFSAAIVSGAVALLLEAQPNDTPDMVKGTLLGTASPGPVGNPFVDGHGALDVEAAAAASPMDLSQSPLLVPTAIGSTVSLQSTWDISTWNPSLWTGTAWNGTAWNGTAWNGTAWNGTAWNGTAWNGTAWNGTAWNGTAWNGTAWNGTAWNGTAWNGTAWNGTAWN